MRLCKDCIHMYAGVVYSWCGRKQRESEPNLITGKTYTIYDLCCFDERTDGDCGYEGKFYSPTLWKRIKTALIGEKNNA